MKDYKIEALRFLNIEGICYKSDFIKMFQNESNPNRAYLRLKKAMAESLESEGILEKEIPRQGRIRKKDETDTIVCLSPEGRYYYTQKETDAFYKKIKSSKAKYFDSIQYEKVVWPYLTTQKLNIMYKRAGVSTYTYEKPSLNYLTYYLFENHCYQKELVIKNNYLDTEFASLSSRDTKIEKLTQFLKEGIFYTKEEVREFINSVVNSGADSFKAVKWNGLFISDKNMFVNFVLSNNYGRDDVAFSSNTEIKNMLSLFSKYLVPMTHVQRNIFKLNDEKRSYQNDIDAIVIGAGSSHTYAEVVGKKFGRIKSSSKTKKNTFNSRPSKMDVLNYNSNNFKKIYSLDDRESGIDMLSYITHFSLEDYHDYEMELFGEDDRFKLSISNFYPAVYEPLGITSIYLPVYEVKTLRKISDEYMNRDSAVMVACTKDMFETISHSLRLEGHYASDGEYLPGLFFVEIISEIDSKGIINEHLGEIYDEKSGAYSIYDKDGYILGEKIFDKFLKEHGKMVSTTGQYTKAAIASRRGKTDQEDQVIRTKFFNDLVSAKHKFNEKGESILEKYLKLQYEKYNNSSKSDVVVVDYAEKKRPDRKVRYSSQMQIMMPPQLKHRIQKMAISKEVTTGYLVREAIKLILDSSDKIKSVYDVDEAGSYDETINTIEKAIDKKTK